MQTNQATSASGNHAPEQTSGLSGNQLSEIQPGNSGQVVTHYNQPAGHTGQANGQPVNNLRATPTKPHPVNEPPTGPSVSHQAIVAQPGQDQPQLVYNQPTNYSQQATTSQPTL